MQNRNWILALLCLVVTPINASIVGIDLTGLDTTPHGMKVKESQHSRTDYRTRLSTGNFEIKQSGTYQMYFEDQDEDGAMPDFDIKITVGKDHLANFTKNEEGFTFDASPGNYGYSIQHKDKNHSRLHSAEHDVTVVLQKPALTAVPLPAAVWFFSSGLLGLMVVTRRKTA